MGVLELCVTSRCEKKCSHCSMEGYAKDNSEIPYSLIENILNAASLAGIDTVYLTGGEPTLYQSLIHVIRKCIELKFSTSLVTRNFNIDPEILFEISKSSESWIGFSLDFFSIMPDAEDLLSIKNMCNKMGLKYGVIHSVSSETYQRIQELEYALDIFKPNNVVLLCTTKMGRAGDMKNIPDVENYFDIVKKTRRYLSPHIIVHSQCQPKSCLSANEESFFISPRGEVYGCKKEISRKTNPIVLGLNSSKFDVLENLLEKKTTNHICELCFHCFE